MSNDTKINTILLPIATGFASNAQGSKEFDVSVEDKLRIVVEGAAGGNVVVVKAKINLESAYENIKTLTGPGSYTVNVSTYDKVKFDVTTYSNSGVEKIVVSSFNEASGSAVIGVPAGTTVEGDPIQFTSTGASVTITKTAEDTINFESAGGGGNSFGIINAPSGSDPVADVASDTLNITSSDGTIDIVGNSATDTLDFTFAGDAADIPYNNGVSGLIATDVQAAIDELVAIESYSDTFVIADWVLNVDHYELVINEAIHLQGINPDASIYETNGAEFDEVSTGLTVTNAGVVTFKVSNVPDLRFDGKFIIK